MTPRLCVFDLDDTLFLERDYVQSGFRAVDGWARAAWCWDGLGEKAWELFLAGARGRIFDDALEALNIAATPAQIARLVEVYREHFPAIELLADVRRFLARHPSLRKAVITDGYAPAQRRKAAALGVAEWFQAVVFTGVWGKRYWKPHPRAFEALESQTGIRPAQCVFFGDNPAKDFHTPWNRGWQVVRIRRPLGLHAAVEMPPALGAVPEIVSLDEWEPPAAGRKSALAGSARNPRARDAGAPASDTIVETASYHSVAPADAACRVPTFITRAL